MDAYEALKETFDDLFQQAVEEGCYTEDEAAELVESLDIYSLLQVVRHNATTVYSYITQGRQERSFNPRSPCGERRDLPSVYTGRRCISTHAPRAGSDQRHPLAGSRPRNFNPRSPCGERRYYYTRLEWHK